MPNFEQGNIIRATGRFFNAASAPVDPTAVSVSYRVGGGAVTTYVYGTDVEVAKSSTGVYTLDLAVGTTAGRWHVRWTGTGTTVAATESSFVVLESQFPEPEE
jgi:hypothetical protein